MTRVAISTLGCRVNRAESAAWAGAFEALGFELCTQTEDADVLVLHSCAVTHAAEQESLRRVRRLRLRRPSAVLVFAGCGTETVGAQRLREAGVDLLVTREDKTRLPSLVAAALGVPARLGGPFWPSFDTTRALLKIQDGCDFRCAYCVVPDTRGAPRSRPLEELCAEAHVLAGRGHREIVLSGVNAGCYADGRWRLPDLVRRLLRDPVIERVRLGSVEPGTVERDLVDLALEEPALCRTFHWPLQSADPGVLRAMRRRYTPAQFESSLEYLFERIPDAGLGTDLMVGFPGETEAAFEKTLAFVERHAFSNLHVFPYSERPGTPASTLPDGVPVAVRRERARRLAALGHVQRRAFARRMVGRVVEVLIERLDADGSGRGWTGEYLEARVAGLAKDAIGRLLSVRVTHVEQDRLGTVRQPERQA